MKLVSWNVNGIRAVMKKGFHEALQEMNADIYCFQEIKALPDQIENLPEDYHVYCNSAVRKGYSGTLTLSRVEPIHSFTGMGVEVFDNEGRILITEFEDFQLINVYTPNSKRELLRLDERMLFEDKFREWILEMDAKKPVIVCGDLNVAHTEIDLARPQQNRRNAGFTDEERSKMTSLLKETKLIDSFRFIYPDRRDKYTWWSYFGKARENNIGWRIDYFLVSEKLKDRIVGADIYDHIFGSDHCPVMLELK